MSIYNSPSLKCAHRPLAAGSVVTGRAAQRGAAGRSVGLGRARPPPSISAGAEASYPRAQSRAVSRSLHTLVQANGGARNATSHDPSSLRPPRVVLSGSLCRCVGVNPGA